MGLCVLCVKTYFSWLSGPRFLHMFSCTQYWAQTVLCIISEIVLSAPVVLYLQHGVRLLFIQSMQCVMRMGVKTSLLICTYTCINQNPDGSGSNRFGPICMKSGRPKYQIFC